MPSSNRSRAGSDLPAVDERLATPETRYEVHDGELVYVSPAHEPHGTRHSKISALVEIHAAPAFDVACDMLTRTSKTDDVAPDVSVFPRARDPSTGGRQLEQLAFEVVSTQSLGDAGHKAAKLVARGVRRVFAIDVERVRALEWSAELESWSMLDSNGFIEDAALAVSLPIDALVRAAAADDAVARALLIKRNPVIEEARALDRSEGKQEGFAKGKQEGFAEGKQEGFAEGKQEGLGEGVARGRAESIIAVLDARGIALDGAVRARILAEREPQALVRWLARAARCADVADLLDEP